MGRNWMLPDVSRVLVCVVLVFYVLYPPRTYAQAVIEWESINHGLQGGAVEELWQSPSGAFFAGGRSSGLFRSPALLEPWAPTTVTKNHALGFTADWEGQLYLLTQQGVLESKDDGLSWSQSTIPEGIWPIYFTVEGVAYGRHSDGVYRRDPNGAWVLAKQWSTDELYGNGDQGIETVRILQLRPDGSLVAGIGAQVFLSNDGDNWDCLSFDESGTCWERQLVWGNGESERAKITSITLLGDDLLIHAAGRYGDQEARYEAASHRVFTPPSRISCGTLQAVETDHSFFVDAKGCCHQGGCGGHGLHRIDKDLDPYTWIPVATRSIGSFRSAYVVDNEERWICEGSGIGVRCTFDQGETWELWNDGLENITASTLFFRKTGELVAGTGYGIMLDQTVTEATWEPLFINQRGRYAAPGCFNAPGTIIEHANDSLYAVIGRSVYNAAQLNDLWNITNASLNCFGSFGPPLYEEKPLVHSRPACGSESFAYRGMYECQHLMRRRLISVDSTMYLNAGKLYRSDDGFVDHLIEITPSWEGREYKPPVIDVLAGNQLLYAMNSTLFVSENQGATWITHELPDAEAAILDITVVKDSVVIVGTTSGLYRSEDNGRTWSGQLLAEGCFNMLESNEKGLVVAGDRFLSRDFGSTWETVTTPLPGSVSALAFDANGVLYTSTVGWGLYRSASPLYTESDAPGPALAEMPVEVYPNPAVEKVYVEVEVESNEEIIIALYDLLGRNMGELERRMLVRGVHRLDVNLPDISSGLYLLRISTANKVTARAVTIL